MRSTIRGEHEVSDISIHAARSISTSSAQAPRSSGRSPLVIVVPDSLLRQRAVRVDVDERATDADAGDAAGEGRLDYLVAVRVAAAADVNGEAPGVRGVPRAPLRKIPLTGAVCAVQHQRDPSGLADAIQKLEEARVHLVNGAGGDAGFELRGLEVLTH